MFQRTLVASLILLATLTSTAHAETVQGRIQHISKKAQTIQLVAKGQPPALVSFDERTRFVNAKGIKDLGTKDLIEVAYAPGQAASRITKVVFDLPAGMEIDAEFLDELMRQKDCLTPAHLEIGAL